ncbi:MAG: hypothetical protein ACPGSB_09710 [Opitutales bacterium]
MKFLEKLFGAESKSTLHPELQQSEREAVIDLLLMAIYVDDHLSLSETKEFDDTTDTLGWDSNTGLSVYISSATDRARTARTSEEGTEAFISFVAERLNSKGSKERALTLLNHLFMADGKTDKEKDFFSKVEAAFAG